MTSRSRSPRRLRWPWWVAALAVCSAAAGGAFLALADRRAPEEQLLRAKHLLATGRYERAETVARDVPEDSAVFARACLVAGEAATKRGRLRDAVAHYARIPDDGSKESIIGLLASGEIHLHRGDLTQSERCYRRVLDHLPEERMAHERLAHILGLEGRRWESIPHILMLIRLDVFTLEQLTFLGDIERMIELKEEHVQKQLTEHGDPGALIGVARVAVNYNRPEQAKELLTRVLKEQPYQIEAQARLGHLLLAPDSSAEFLRWHAALPAGADEHPEIWVVRGLWAQDHGEPRTAVRCMWEAVRRDPNHVLANHHLGRLLTQLGEPDRSDAFLKRAEQLRVMSELMNLIYTEEATSVELKRAADLNESLGRLWEAWAWSRVALARDRQAVWAAERMRHIESVLTADTPRTVPERNPALSIDLSSYPLPQWSAPPASEHPGSSEPARRPAAPVAFADRAQEAGIDFRYFNDPESSRHLGGWRMYQFTGGGVAALDFDGDYWPDLHFTQGCRWPAAQHSGSHTDRLYRNRGNGRFADVTQQAGVGDGDFSQGAAVGDFNSDGFPDLYVGNIGRNRLYRNNGDGTFTDVTDECGIQGEWWTASCALADLNGDGHPEIYDANFLTGDDVYDLVCKGKDGTARSCPPTHFPAAPDQVYLNQGDGRFADVTQQAGIDVPDGNGLGVVAADFTGSGRIDLFVANDSVPNFYFANQTDRPGGPLAFQEEAVIRGLAVDRDGKSQACMGVAVDDADGDGLIDLFVTNFYGESNTLYHQQTGGLFIDATRQFGLREPSLQMLGFGAQFLDGELDGLPDLVATNGHVDDFSHKEMPYRMPPQYFRNVGNGRFEELRAPSLGAYFQQKWLGRGLTRVDWNRDGREDFVVSHLLDAPAALMTNETKQVGHHLALHLRGISGNRDAVGAVVRVTAGDRTWTRQLTAGDGYMASNDRKLVFGLGDRDRVDAVEIHWPSGPVQRIENLAADSEWLMIEGRSRPLRLRPETAAR